MAFDEHEVRSLARLARLALTDEESREAAGHLDRLLRFVAQIQAIDVEGAPETVHVSGSEGAPLRPDVARPGFPRDVMMAGAPAASAGLFEVPRVVVRTGEGAATDDDEAAG